MKIIIALVIIALYIAGCIDKGTKDDPCWKCKKDDCEECEYWRKMTNEP